MRIRSRILIVRLIVAPILLAVLTIGQATGVRGATSSALLDARQRSLHVAALRDVPKSTSALLASIAALKTNILSKDPVLKHCASGYCSFDLGGSKPSDGSLSVYMVGDSHIGMWIPAVYSALRNSKVHLKARWAPGCPIADVTLWGIFNGATYDETCRAWRTKVISLVTASKPDYVIVSERTSTLYSASQERLTTTQLQIGLERSIRQFTSRGIGVIVVGDSPPFTGWQNPASCVSVNLKSLTRCAASVVSSSLDFQSLSAGERAASLSTNATFIDTTPWLCDLITQRCPAVIDDAIAYEDSSHISASESSRLAPLMTAVLKPALKLR